MTSASELKQRELIRSFDREHLSYTGQVPWALPGLFSFMGGIISCLPWNREDFFGILNFSLLISVWIPYFLLLPYQETAYRNQPMEKKQKIYQVLQYLPVSVKQIRIVRIQYIWNYLWKFSLVMVLLQTISSCIFARFSFVNILWVASFSLVLPMGMGILQVLTSTRKARS